MFWLGIISAVAGLIGWILGFICLRGLNKVLLNFLYKEDRDKFKEQHDVIAMNRYISKTILFPSAILMTVTTVLIFFRNSFFMKSVAFGVVFAVAAVVTVGYCLYAVVQISGDRFKK